MPQQLTEMTALDVIKSSLKVLGVKGIGDHVGSDEASECLDVMNMMIDEWNLKTTMPFFLLNEVFDLVESKEEYTIGVGGDFDTTRPISISSAFSRSNESSDRYPTDRKIEIIDNDQFQRIVTKNYEKTYPEVLTYTPSSPLGIIRMSGLPMVNLKLGLTQKKQLETYYRVTDLINLPHGYLMALRYNLAINLAPIYGKELPMGGIIWTKANESLGDIMTMNTNPPLSTLGNLSRDTKRRTYNIYEE